MKILKLLALFSMILDHIGLFFNVHPLRIIGRISFPIYAYLIAKGIENSRNLITYGNRVILLAVISQFIWSLVGVYQLDVLFMYALFIYLTYFFNNGLTVPSSVLVFILVLTAPYTDYGIYGYLTLLIFYKTKDRTNLIKLFILLNILCIGLGAVSLIQIYSILSLHLIFSFDKKNYYINNKYLNKFFYYIYPIHLVVLIILKLLFN